MFYLCMPTTYYYCRIRRNRLHLDLHLQNKSKLKHGGKIKQTEDNQSSYRLFPSVFQHQTLPPHHLYLLLFLWILRPRARNHQPLNQDDRNLCRPPPAVSRALIMIARRTWLSKSREPQSSSCSKTLLLTIRRPALQSD
jgi:hypothetical protein